MLHSIVLSHSCYTVEGGKQHTKRTPCKMIPDLVHTAAMSPVDLTVSAPPHTFWVSACVQYLYPTGDFHNSDVIYESIFSVMHDWVGTELDYQFNTLSQRLSWHTCSPCWSRCRSKFKYAHSEALMSAYAIPGLLYT